MSNAEECWSADEENFNYKTLGDLLDSHGEFKAGDIVYVGKPGRPTPNQLCDGDDIIEVIQSRACDVAGEYAEDYPDVSKEAIQELNELITGWIEKHCPPNFYEVNDVHEYVITEGDIES